MNEEHEEHLERCPFCGSDNLGVNRIANGWAMASVFCYVCGGGSGERYTDANAIDTWNHRTADSENPDRIEDNER